MTNTKMVELGVAVPQAEWADVADPFAEDRPYALPL